MKPHHAPRHARGFTLVETIIVLLVVSIAAAAVIAMQGNLFRQQGAVSDLQVRARLASECAEQVLALRRHAPDGYEAIASPSYGNNACGGITALGGHGVASVAITNPYSGPACPNTGNCKLLVISQEGQAPLTLMLVDF